MIVIDASALLDIVLYRPNKLIQRVHTEDLHAPAFIDLETTNGLRRLVAKQQLSEGSAAAARVSATLLPVSRHGHAALLDRIWELRHRLTAYDATYLALAEAFDVPLITSDRGLAAVAGERAELFEN